VAERATPMAAEDRRADMVVCEGGQPGRGVMFRRWFDICLHSRPDCPRIREQPLIEVSEREARGMMGYGWYPCAVCAPGLFW